MEVAGMATSRESPAEARALRLGLFELADRTLTSCRTHHGLYTLLQVCQAWRFVGVSMVLSRVLARVKPPRTDNSATMLQLLLPYREQ